MSKWTVLSNAIREVIYSNGNREITGQVLQNALLNIISNLGNFASFAGVATPSTNPGTPDGPVYYFATQAGTYTNFGALVLDGSCYVLYWNGTAWSSAEMGLPSMGDVTSAMNALIATETTARQQADGTLGAAITSEVTRATAKEEELSSVMEVSASDLIAEYGPSAFVQHGYWKAGNGALDTSGYQCYMPKVAVSAGQIVKYKVMNASTAIAFVAAYDANDTYLANLSEIGVASGSASQVERTYTVPAGVAYIGVSHVNQTKPSTENPITNVYVRIYGSSIRVDGQKIKAQSIPLSALEDGASITSAINSIESTQEAIDEITASTTGDLAHEYGTSDFTSRKYYRYNDGGIATGYQAGTDLISVTEKQVVKYKVSSGNSSAVATIAAFDASSVYQQSKSVRSSDLGPNTKVERTYVVPAGVAYIGVSHVNGTSPSTEQPITDVYVRVYDPKVGINGEALTEGSVDITKTVGIEPKITEHVIIVKRYGTAGTDCDFAGLNGVYEALESITDNSYYNRYLIKIIGHFLITDVAQVSWHCCNSENHKNTWWANWYGKDYVTLDGGSSKQTSLTIQFTGNSVFPMSADNTRQYNGTNYHVLFATCNYARFKNIKFSGTNTRYCVHNEGGVDADIAFEDCEFSFLKTYSWPDSYNADNTFGLGLREGLVFKVIRSIINHSSSATAVGGHSSFNLSASQLEKTTGARLIFDGCTFNIYGDIGNGSYYPLSDVIELRNCNFSKTTKASTSANYSNSDAQLARPASFFCDKPIVVKSSLVNNILRFDPVSASVTSIRIVPTCSAYSSIIAFNDYTAETGWANYDTECLSESGAKILFEQEYKEGLGCFAISTRPFSVCRLNNDSLGKLLGDCSASSKELVVSVDGTNRTVTFTTNLTNATDSDVISIINNQIGEYVTVSIDKYENYQYGNVQGIYLYKNTGNSPIRKKDLCFCYSHVCTTAADSSINAIAFDDIPVGSFGRLFIKGALIDSAFMGLQTNSQIAYYKVEDGALVATQNKAEAWAVRTGDVLELIC